MKRFRIGLRLMLLVVAFFAVLFAWIGVELELERIELRGEIRRMEIYREYAAQHVGDPQHGKAWQQSVHDVESAIRSRRRQLGEPERRPNDDN